eukprot:4911250-Amphidinium_carterae.1
MHQSGGDLSHSLLPGPKGHVFGKERSFAVVCITTHVLGKSLRHPHPDMKVHFEAERKENDLIELRKQVKVAKASH